MKLIQLNCHNCNGNLDIDVDNLIAYCPYCGQKLLFDTELLNLVLAEKEKTKRAQEITKREQEKTKRLELEQKYNKQETKAAVKIVFACFIFAALIFLLLDKI